MENIQSLVSAIEKEFGFQLPQKMAVDQVRDSLATHINEMIIHHFNDLVNLLYRLDVNENKLKEWLAGNNGEDAGKIIATLIIERQLQKMKSREQYKQQDNPIDEDEKW
jgi:hypothetical protein